MRRNNVKIVANVPVSYPRPRSDTRGTSEKIPDTRKAIGSAKPDKRIRLFGKVNVPSFIRATSHKKNAIVTSVEIRTLLLTSSIAWGMKNIGIRNARDRIIKNTLLSSFDSFVVETERVLSLGNGCIFSFISAVLRVFLIKESY